jgi:hypothetical protein
MKPRIKKSNLTYYPIQSHWRKIAPVIRSAECEAIWRPNMVDYNRQRASDNGFKYNPRPFWYPRCCDGCDWRCDRVGKHPAYWDFVCHSACHWLVDMCLYVANKIHPEVQWRIVSSHKHSTVWNGEKEWPVLFDLNFLALGVCPKQAWELAIKGRVLKPGKWLHPWNAP